MTGHAVDRPAPSRAANMISPREITLRFMAAPTDVAKLDSSIHHGKLLEWIDKRPRTYAEVLEVWRTSCPRMSIWEDACIEGLIDCDSRAGRIVSLSPKGQALLKAHRQS